VRGSHIVIPKAIAPEAVIQLAHDIDYAIADDATTHVVIEGRDGVFCEGLDFAALAFARREGAKSENFEAEIREAVEAFAHCLTALRFSRKPTMALVDGPARGGGVGIAAACDVLIAAETGAFALPEVLFGLLPAVVLPFLLDRIPMQKIRLWALTGQSRTAQEAMAIGLVDEVVPLVELEKASRRWLRSLSRSETNAATALKYFTAEAALNRDAALKHGIELTTRALHDEAVLAAVRRFVETEIPPWEVT